MYVNMASVSHYRSYAKCGVLGTKTLTSHPGHWESATPTEVCNYQDNHSQQRHNSVG